MAPYDISNNLLGSNSTSTCQEWYHPPRIWVIFQALLITSWRENTIVSKNSILMLCENIFYDNFCEKINLVAIFLRTLLLRVLKNNINTRNYQQSRKQKHAGCKLAPFSPVIKITKFNYCNRVSIQQRTRGIPWCSNSAAIADRIRIAFLNVQSTIALKEN